MAKKRKIKAWWEDDAEDSNRKHYPVYAVWARYKSLTENDTAFILLLWSGCSAVMAYRVAYRPNASAHSIATMASRLRREVWVEEALDNLHRGRPRFGYDSKY